MTDWSAIFLGVIALSTLTMALIQVGAIVAASRAARRTTEALARVEGALQPLLARTEGLAERSSHLVARLGQTVDRAEQLIGVVETRVNQASDAVEAGVKAPAREAAAMLAGVQAAVTSMRHRLSASASGSKGRRSAVLTNGADWTGRDVDDDISLGG